ncbi:prolyl endopeptidase-like [Sitodiplosis mosellana]|uniref:prolyl endopeptidase-like n=1 Tax=Sitodiplosis mosellana TaxID=263140 RepID=UPI0024450606|nr:prolyl endopeptidase-like [Sitodiplosis mosellana]
MGLQYDPKANGNRNLYYHYLDEHKPDKLIARIPKAEAYEVSFKISHDHRYLIIFDSQALYAANIESLDEEIQFKMIFKLTENISYEYVGNEGDFFLFLKNIGAPKHHLVEIDITDKKPGRNFDVVVAENLNGHGVLKTAYAFSTFILLIYIERFQSSMYLYSSQSERIEYKIDLKNEQVVSSSIDKYGVFFETRSFKTPRKVYRIEFNQLLYREPYVTTYSTIEPVLWKESKIPNLDELKITVQYDTYRSFDGTEVPMTIIQKKQSDCYRKPCLVYAYGGFGDCLLPRFDLYFLLFVELFNGVVVFIHIRGGGELGDVWSLKSSQIEISFNDLIAGVEYLKGESYTDTIDSNKIAYHGTSHGGLVGAVVMNLRPNLFTAVTLLNGYFDLIIDLLDGDRLNQYGNINKKRNFDVIKKYAPLLHIQYPTRSESYPTTLIVASKKDDVVPMSNSLKYLAHRRENAKKTQAQREKPTLFKVINSGGHNYRTAIRRDFIDAVFVKLKFLAEAMELRCDKVYQTN